MDVITPGFLGPSQNVQYKQAAQTHVTRCNVIYILTFSETERDL